MPECPKCGSTQVYYRQILREFVCRRCGKVWKPEEKVERKQKKPNEKGARKLAGDIFGVSYRNVLPGIVVSLEDVLSTLLPREQRVLELRYGLKGDGPRTLAEVASIIGVTSRERPRQIQAKALRKLRYPSRSRKLKPFIVGSRKGE